MDLISTEIFESQNRGLLDGSSWLNFVQGPLVENEFDKRFKLIFLNLPAYFNNVSRDPRTKTGQDQQN